MHHMMSKIIEYFGRFAEKLRVMTFFQPSGEGTQHVHLIIQHSLLKELRRTTCFLPLLVQKVKEHMCNEDKLKHAKN